VLALTLILDTAERDPQTQQQPAQPQLSRPQLSRYRIELHRTMRRQLGKASLGQHRRQLLATVSRPDRLPQHRQLMAGQLELGEHRRPQPAPFPASTLRRTRHTHNPSFAPARQISVISGPGDTRRGCGVSADDPETSSDSSCDDADLARFDTM
jgi:hypothetical protein